MYHWTEHQASGKERWQTLIDEAENRRRAKRAGAQRNLLSWLRSPIKHNAKRSEAGPLRPASAKE